jgi:hypothetical protein
LGEILTGGALSSTALAAGGSVAASFGHIAVQNMVINDFTADAAWAWCTGFLDGVFSGNNIGDAFAEGDRRATNSWKITQGLFMADDENGNDFNEFLQVASRFTWQQPMTSIGYEYSQANNHFGRVDVDYFNGATVIRDPGANNGSISMGGYIRLNPSKGPLDYTNETLLHEYGHFAQTRDWGGLLTLVSSSISLADAISNSSSVHDKLWVERDANARALNIFEGRQGFESGSVNYADFIRSCGIDNIRYYDNRFLKWWYIVHPDPVFDTYYNVNNNPR